MKTLFSSCRFVAIAGTWAQRDPEAARDPWRDWWHPQSHWAAEMRALGWRPLRPDPFRWSTDLDGTWLQRVVQRRIFGDWWSAAFALCYYCGHEPTIEAGPVQARQEAKRWVSQRGALLGLPVLIAHSHGGQVALLAIRLGLPVHGLITVSTPVRRDVLAEVQGTTPRRWVHVHASKADKWQWLGEIGDGVFGVVRKMPVDDVVNLATPDRLGHSGLLTTPMGLRHWSDIMRAYGAIEGEHDVESEYVRS